MKNLILLATFFVFNFFSIAQKAPSTKKGVEFRVYKEYDKKGNLIRYDSTRVEKGHRLHNSFQFKFLSNSLPIHNLRMDSLMSHKRAFLFKDRDLLDSLKGHKMVPNISIFRKNSVMEIPNHFLHFKRDLQKKIWTLSWINTLTGWKSCLNSFSNKTTEPKENVAHAKEEGGLLF
ncbi:MAG: hypothetical protein P8I75_04530 [Flavobacteriaceae bacterium]|nr:hypothetical protein [Flavobacteriaceae bacterium]MDG1920456.1 hypothetical protein [Flavobacteriaceae bacterium]